VSTSQIPAAAALEGADIHLGRRLAQGRHRPLVRGAAKVGKLGDQEPLYVLAAALGVVGLIARRPAMLGLGVRMGLAVVAADLAKSGLKRLIRRSRPHLLLDEGRYEAGLGGSQDKELQSFPSGHVAGGVAAAAALWRLYPRSAPLGIAACGFLGWSRMSKGAHWPLDVAAGAAAGLVAEAASTGALRLAGQAAARSRSWRRRTRQRGLGDDRRSGSAKT
jgi:membrane-associated phospholipid phosphatase